MFLKGDFTIITQNVDNLHERAGSKNVIHMHGQLTKIRCQKSNKVFENVHNIFTDTTCQCCEESGNLRPHIVWFGEIPLYMDKIEQKLLNCDLFIAQI